MAFKKILCAVDFSPCSNEALRVAAELARDGDAPLVIAHAWELVRWTTVDFQLAPEVIQDSINTAEAELAKCKVAARGFGAKEVATRLYNGPAWDQIVAAARDDGAIDLVVVGTHGRTGLKHALLGSVAEKIVRHAPCAVLVVRGGAS
jgi:nucleotide-binding universal stress UspA family protein